VIFITRNTNAAAVAAPNPLMVLDTHQKTRENENGRSTTPRTNATYGFGLKLCVSPSEIGNTKKKINHITLNQKIPKDIGRIIFRKLFV
jgi:hypothetical protein